MQNYSPPPHPHTVKKLHCWEQFIGKIVKSRRRPLLGSRGHRSNMPRCRVAAAEFKRNMPRWLAVHSVHWDSKMMSDLSNELREILAILVSDASDYVEGELIGMFA